MGYTWRQYTNYLRLARRRAACARLERISDMAAAFHGGEGARALAKKLGEQAGDSAAG